MEHRKSTDSRGMEQEGRMNEKELMPCPFCGNDAEMVSRMHIPNGKEYTPRCSSPSCAGRLTKRWLIREEAVAAWNRRAES